VRFFSVGIFDSKMRTPSIHQRQHAPGQTSLGMGTFGLQLSLRLNHGLDDCHRPTDLTC
jgi:hypothetical protein